MPAEQLVEFGTVLVCSMQGVVKYKRFLTTLWFHACSVCGQRSGAEFKQVPAIRRVYGSATFTVFGQNLPTFQALTTEGYGSASERTPASSDTSPNILMSESARML